MKTLSFTIYSIIGAVAIMAAFAIIPIITLFFVNTFAELGGSPNSVDHYYHKSQIPSIEYLKEIRRDGGRFYFIEPRKKWLGLF